MGPIVCTEASVTNYQSTLRNTSEDRRSLKMRVSENVLRKISGPRKEKVTGDWGKLRNEECTGLHFSPDTVWVIQSRGRRLVWRVALTGGAEMCAEFCWGSLK
jgi:hypothetical protein